jgi:arylsulfatase A-like enzyme
MSGPGIPRGEQRRAYCYLLDIYPTLCDLLGIPIPDSVEGRSLAPVFWDAQTVVRDTLYCAYRGLQRCLRDDKLKLIEYVVDGQQTSQLFDVRTDPWEMRNLVDEPGQRDRVREMQRALLRRRTELDDNREPFWEHYRPSD